MYTICLVEDENSLRELIKMYLEKEGYKVIEFFNGHDALNYVGQKSDLWILDIMLGDDISGYDIIKKIREFNRECDDYLAKPYSTKELILRVNKLIDRIYKDKEPNSIINYENYIIDLNKRAAKENDKEIKLTTLEFDLLILFLNNKNRTFSREEILKNIWGEDYFGSDRAVDDLVRRLRKKMPNLNVSTIYGYGYRLS